MASAIAPWSPAGTFLRGAFCLWSGGACAAAVGGQRRQDFVAVSRRFDFAEAKDSTQLGESGRLQTAEIVQRGVVQHDEGRDALLLGRGAAPFAEEVAEAGVHRSGKRRCGSTSSGRRRSP